MTMRRALDGIRVLDFCWVGAGALVTKLLAEHGADVIKVESRARPDNLRLAPPFRPGANGLDGSGYFASRNNDKRSLALDMRNERSRELARALAAKCDLVTNNFRPGVMESWGLDYEALSTDNPGLIYLSMPMNGATGPDRSAIGFGSTIAAQAGLVHLSGRPDRPPVGTGTHYPDHVPSPGHALVALLAVLLQRRRTGVGRMIEISQLESTVNAIGSAVVAASIGAEPARTGNRVPGHHPSGVFRCSGDDDWIALGARSDEEWRRLAAALSPGLEDDPRFLTSDARAAIEDELERTVAALVRVRDRDELAADLRSRSVPAWPVLTSEDLLRDEHLRARAFWRTLDHAVIGEFTMPSAPFAGRAGRTGPERAAPLLGEHTREVVTSLLGLSDTEVDELVAEGVLR
jgi:crotonobetainyl-CoA:carnitine CoA-transferase CaiB-like acyl-CoA transferase